MSNRVSLSTIGASEDPLFCGLEEEDNVHTYISGKKDKNFKNRLEKADDKTRSNPNFRTEYNVIFALAPPP